jgi:hypothetical protein
MLINAIMVVDADKTTAQDLALPRCLKLGGESQLHHGCIIRNNLASHRRRRGEFIGIN